MYYSVPNRGKKIILLIFIDLLHLIKTFFVMIPIIFVLFTQVVLQKPKCIRDREGKITLSISNKWGNYLWKISTEQGLSSWTSISPSSGTEYSSELMKKDWVVNISIFIMLYMYWQNKSSLY